MRADNLLTIEPWLFIGGLVVIALLCVYIIVVTTLSDKRLKDLANKKTENDLASLDAAKAMYNNISSLTDKQVITTWTKVKPSPTSGAEQTSYDPAVHRKEIGQRIRASCRDMTQSDLARQTKITNSSISKFVTGKRKPSHNSLCKIAKVLNVDVNYILTGENPQQVVSAKDHGLNYERLLRCKNHVFYTDSISTNRAEIKYTCKNCQGVVDDTRYVWFSLGYEQALDAIYTGIKSSLGIRAQELIEPLVTTLRTIQKGKFRQ
jgi:transcriptional regulator with XRE-family HTH domain